MQKNVKFLEHIAVSLFDIVNLLSVLVLWEVTPHGCLRYIATVWRNIIPSSPPRGEDGVSMFLKK